MTSSGKVRIYELSKDLGLENKDVLDAAEKLSIAAKSHSSSISDAEAGKIRNLLKTGGNGAQPSAPTRPAPGKAILSVKKAAPPAKPTATKPAPAKPSAPPAATPVKPAASKPVAAKPATTPAKVSAPPARPAATATALSSRRPCRARRTARPDAPTRPRPRAA